MKVLIVDDIPSNRILLDKMVRMTLQCNTVHAGDGAEALTKLEASIPDIILLDVMMPGMNGSDFLKRLRSDERWKSIPVIMTTGAADEPIVKEIAALGVSGYLLRPFSAKDVVQSITMALKNQASRGG